MTTVVNYVKKEANIYSLFLHSQQAEVAFKCSKVQFSVVTSRKRFLTIKVTKPWVGYLRKCWMPTVFLSIFLRRFECFWYRQSLLQIRKWTLSESLKSVAFQLSSTSIPNPLLAQALGTKEFGFSLGSLASHSVIAGQHWLSPYSHCHTHVLPLS